MGTVELISLALRLAIPWVKKKWGNKVLRYVQLAIDFIDYASTQSWTNAEKKDFVLRQLASSDGWQDLRDKQQDRVMEFVYEAQKDPQYGVPLVYAPVAVEVLHEAGYEGLSKNLAEELMLDVHKPVSDYKVRTQ